MVPRADRAAPGLVHVRIGVSSERREPIKFKGIRTVQWLMSPVPRPRIVDLLRRLLRAPEVPKHVRSAAATPEPSLDTSAWQEVETRIGGVRLRMPPGLDADPFELPSLENLAAGEILVGLWRAEGRSLAIWARGQPEFPVGAYSVRQRPTMEERTEARESIAGRDVAIAAFRVSLRGQAPKYEVVAYWPFGRGIWMRAAAHADRRGGQEEFLCALRTLRIEEDEWTGWSSGDS